MPPTRARRKSYRRTMKLQDAVFEKCGGLCHYCKSPVIFIRSIPEANRIRETGNSIIYLNDSGERISRYFATVDHDVPHAKGGTDSLENLLLSCHNCNRKRNPEWGKPNKKSIICDCGRRKAKRRHVTCEHCRRTNYENWLVEQMLFTCHA